MVHMLIIVLTWNKTKQKSTLRGRQIRSGTLRTGYVELDTLRQLGVFKFQSSLNKYIHKKWEKKVKHEYFQ